MNYRQFMFDVIRPQHGFTSKSTENSLESSCTREQKENTPTFVAVHYHVHGAQH